MKTSSRSIFDQRYNLTGINQVIEESKISNPISPIATCYRVVDASGKLAGFVGGADNKNSLLKMGGKKKNPELLLEIEIIAAKLIK